MRHRAMRDDPAPHGNVPVGVWVADYPVTEDADVGIGPEHDEKRQREAKTAAAGR